MLITAAGLLAQPGAGLGAETWRLNEQGQWKAVSAEDKYLLAVAEIKKLVNMGETSAVRGAIDKLKKDFPETAGPDLDAFMNAEMLYSQGKFTRRSGAMISSWRNFLKASFTKQLWTGSSP